MAASGEKNIIEDLLDEIKGFSSSKPTLFDGRWSVEIEGIVFQLHARSSENQRNHILYSSQTPEGVRRVWLAYKSNSEGFWRLAILSLGHYEKGQDYITTSFLHMRLQHFFESSYAELPEKRFLKSFRELRIDTNLFVYQEPDKPMRDPQSRFENYRKLYDPYFFQLEQYCPHPTERKLGCISNPILMYYDAKSNFIDRENYLEAKRDAEDEGRRIKVRHPKNIINPILYDDESIEDGFRAMILAYGEGKNLGNWKAKDSLGLISQFMQENFTVDLGHQRYLFDLTLSFQTPADARMGWGKDEVSLTLHLYETYLRNQKTGNDYFLYYTMYDYKGVQYKGIVNLVPVEAQILPSGLYSQFISAGYYIFKPFDYVTQCTGTNEASNCTTQYAFLGGLFTSLWPLPLLLGTANSSAATSGGRRKKTRRCRRPRRKSRRSKS